MKAKARFGVVFLMAVAVACETSTGPPVPTVVIAADLPVVAADIQTVVHAIELAVSEHSRIQSFRVEFMPLDDSLGRIASPMLGVQNIKYMIADPQVMGMIGPFNSYVLNDEVPRANSGDLVMLSPSSTNTCVTAIPSCTDQMTAILAGGHANFFRIAAPDYRQGTAMGRFAGTRGIKRVAVVNVWGPDGVTLVADFKQELAASGGSVVWEQDISPTDDFSSFLQKARSAGAQAVYAVGQGNQGICALGAEMKQDFSYLLTMDGATGDDHCFADSVAPPTQIFGTFSDVDPTKDASPASRKAVAAYEKAYPQDKELSSFTFAAYDCALILIDAITKVVLNNGGASPTRAEVLKAVAEGRFTDGVTGSYSFDRYGDAISPLMALWTVQDGKWKYLRQVDAGPAPA